MVRAFRHAALTGGLIAGLAATAHAQKFQNLVVTGVDLKTTSGTLVVQRVTAEEAVMSDDGLRVITSKLQLTSFLDDEGGKIKATAPGGEIVVGGEKIVWEPSIPKPDYFSIKYYGTEFSTSGARGDVLLVGNDEEDVVAEIGERATVNAPALIWSKRHNRFLVPRPFDQVGVIGSGDEIHISAAALSADEFFHEWIYYTAEDESIVIEYTRPEQETSE